MTTQTIHATRVWMGFTHDGRDRFDVIGQSSDGRNFRASTLSAWMASLWTEAAKTHAALEVTWQSDGEGRYKNLTNLELAAQKTATI